MVWLFLGIVLFLNSSLQPADTTLKKQSRDQVRFYVQSVQDQDSIPINLWALSDITQDNPSLKSYLIAYLDSTGSTDPRLRVFQNTALSHSAQLKQLTFSSASPFLLVSYLLSESDSIAREQTVQTFKKDIGFRQSEHVNYEMLVEALLNSDRITSEILPANKFHPVHFLLFFSSSVMQSEAFSSEYLSTAAENWDFTNDSNLNNSLGIVSLYKIYYDNYEYEETASLYRSIINDRLFPNSKRRLSILRALDYCMYRLGYYNRNLKITQSYTLPLAKYLRDNLIVIKLKIDLGASLFRIGKIEESKRIYLEVLNDLSPDYSSISKARIYNNLAINYWKSGEFDGYLNYQFKALKEAKAEDNYSLRMDIFKNLFIHYRINKDFDSAKQYLSRAKKLAEQKKEIKDLAQLSYYEGQLFRDINSDTEKAISSFNVAINLLNSDEYYRPYQIILNEKGLLLEKGNNFTEASNLFNEIIAEAQKRSDRRNSVYATFNLVNIKLKEAKLDSAKTILDTLTTKNLDELDFYQLVKAKTVQARYNDLTGDPEAGVHLLQPVIEQIVSRSRGSGDLETGFWQVEPEYLDAFELYANLLISTDQHKHAVEVLDQLKTINDAALYQNPLVRSKVLNEKELSEYKRLTDELDVLRKNLLASSGDKQEEIQQNIDELSARKNIYDQRISSRADTKPTSIDKIQRRMDAHQRVIHTTALNDIYYIALISRTSVEFKKIPITARIRATFEQSIREMAKGSTDLNNLYAITELLDISAIPSHVDKLTIIPDSYLFQVPLDVLPVEQPANNYSYGDVTYLIENFETNYMTSLNDFTKDADQPQYKFDYVGFGVSQFDEERGELVPLPEADVEIQTIARQLSAFKQKKTFLNTNATEQTFRANAPNSRILHLATHSEVASQDPMFSSFYLNRTEEDNQNRFPGRIFAYELFELNLENQLIMLNSCESGSGSYLPGTGIVGISRALRYAGAQSLVLNIWSVNDMMASEFAVKFYEHINNGQSKSDALRNAKLHFLQTKNANPHYWGSYMLLGDEDAIVKPYEFTNHVVAASFFLFFFAIATASSILEIRRRRNL